jgi:geranylgeranyl diphosphate synthase, type II
MQTLSQILIKFNDFVKKQSFHKEPIALYEPIAYILTLGGKRIRPILSIAAYQLFKDNTKKAYPVAFAVEMFHNFSLMHDDIMDEAPLRRGKPTVHTKYNVNTGILSGDAMLILAYESLTSVSADNKTVTKLIKIFNKVAIEVCEGQQFDINFEKFNTIQINDYLKMIELKTAVLLAAALEMGAVLAKASDEDAKHLYEFGRNIGIAFQLQDDILDTYGDPATFGKKVGGDIAQNKKTFLYLKALELSNEENAKQLYDLYNSNLIEETEKINQVKNLFNQVGVRQLAENLQDDYYKKGMEHLSAVSASDERKQPLMDLVQELMIRLV